MDYSKFFTSDIIKESGKTNVVLNINKDISVIKYQVDILSNDTPENFIKSKLLVNDAIESLYMDITDLKRFNIYIKEEVLTKSRIIKLFESIYKAINQSEDYLLDSANLLLQKEYIYIDAKTDKLYVIYLPLDCNFDVNEGVKNIVYDIVTKSAFIENESGDNFVQTVLNSINKSSFNERQLGKIIDNLKNYDLNKEDINDNQEKEIQKEEKFIPVKSVQNNYTVKDQSKVELDKTSVINIIFALLIEFMLIIIVIWFFVGEVYKKAGSDFGSSVAGVVIIVSCSQYFIYKKIIEPKVDIENLKSYFNKENKNIKTVTEVNETKSIKKPNSDTQFSFNIPQGIDKSMNKSTEKKMIKNNDKKPTKVKDKVIEIKKQKKYDIEIKEVKQFKKATEENELNIKNESYKQNIKNSEGIINIYVDESEKDDIDSKENQKNINDNYPKDEAEIQNNKFEETVFMDSFIFKANACLVDNNGTKIDIEKEDFVIGRNSEKCDLVVNSNTVGREHAIIKYIDSEYYIEDLQSKNGTFVNNLKIESGVSIKINNKDEIAFADFKVVFEIIK